MLGHRFRSLLQGLRDNGDIFHGSDGVDTGVLCATEVPNGVVLGSVEGELRIGEGLKDERTGPYMLQIRYADGKIITTDKDSEVYWMRFISAARNDAEQNTEADTNASGQVILRTTRRILIGEELLVWYSDKLQRIMNILPVLPSRDRTGQLRYVCQFCSKSFRHPNTLKSHLRFSCTNDSTSSSMLFPSCQPISRPKHVLDVSLPIHWSGNQVLGSRFDISLLRPLTNTMVHSESPPIDFRAFKPINKCSERHTNTSKTHQENEVATEEAAKTPLSPDLGVPSPIKSTISSSNYDFSYRFHSHLFNCPVPPMNFSSSFATMPFRSHLNASSCLLYRCSCYPHNHGINSPVETLPHQHFPFKYSDIERHPSTSRTDGVRRWPFHSLFPYTSDCPVKGGGTTEDRQNSSPESHLIIQNASQKSKRGHLCIYCGKFYSRKYGLKIHLRTHTGYKPLKCKVCLRPFGDPSNLNKHIRLHAEGETPYRCEFCGKVLVRRRDLERHIKSRHPTEISQDTEELINVDDISPPILLSEESKSDHKQAISDEEPTIIVRK